MNNSNSLTWLIQTSPEGSSPAVFSEYVLNDLGIFIKRERRVVKKKAFYALTGFRVGYAPVPGTDYRAAPLDRNVILWYKLASIVSVGADEFEVTGNSEDKFILKVPAELMPAVQQFVGNMRSKYPPMVEPDQSAAAWLCWRDDDEWEDPLMSLTDMIAAEKTAERYIDPDVLEETRLPSV